MPMTQRYKQLYVGLNGHQKRAVNYAIKGIGMTTCEEKINYLNSNTVYLLCLKQIWETGNNWILRICYRHIMNVTGLNSVVCAQHSSHITWNSNESAHARLLHLYTKIQRHTSYRIKKMNIFCNFYSLAKRFLILI